MTEEATVPTGRDVIVQIPCGMLVGSKRNPRSKYSRTPESLAELEASIRQDGIQQPILVRPKDGKFEIVFGERRFLAGQKAGLEHIPALVRDLTDDEAMELCLVENLQRADVHYLDEAKGFAELLKHHTPKEIGEQLGKAEVEVHKRLALNKLSGKWVDAAYQGRISFVAALLLARLTQTAQASVWKYLSGRNDKDQVISYGEIKRYVENDVLISLEGVAFATGSADLVPKAGACTNCPKRTGANPMLFSDVQHGDICTDRDCFRGKCQAYLELRKKEFPKATLIITDDINNYLYREELGRLKVVPESKYGGEGWHPAKKDECEFVTDGLVAVGPKSGLHRTICFEPGCPVHGRGRGQSRVKATPGVINKERAEQVEQLWHRRTAKAVRLALHAAMRKAQDQDPQAYRNVPLEGLRLAVRESCRALRPQQDGNEYLESLWIPPKDSPAPDRYTSGPVMKCIAGAKDHATLIRILIDYVVAQDVAGKFSGGEFIVPLVKAYGLDAKAIAAPIEKDWNEKKQLSYARRDARLAKEREKLARQKESKNASKDRKASPDATGKVSAPRPGRKAVGKKAILGKQRRNPGKAKGEVREGAPAETKANA